MNVDDQTRFHDEWNAWDFLKVREARVGWDGNTVVWLRGCVPPTEGERELMRLCLTSQALCPLSLQLGEWAWW